jgi:hypothetical protein
MNAPNIHVRSTESGYDFITLYLKDKIEVEVVSRLLYNEFKRIRYENLELQRKNFMHLPGDVPHFHNGFEGALPHFHIIYERRPTAEDWQKLISTAKRVGISIGLDNNIEIS